VNSTESLHGDAARLSRFDARPLLEGTQGDEVGLLSILRRQPGGEENDLHRALVPFAGADLGQGLTGFLQSDRANAGHVVLEVLHRPGEPLAAVAGALVIPDSEDGAEAARKVADELREGGLTRLLQSADGPNSHALANRIADRHALGPLLLKSELRPRFSCRCSRERLVRALQTLPAPELLDMAHKDGGAQASCDFCAETYVVTGDELVALAEAGERV
jgi:molecular chaperone Hsp33